MSRWGSAPEWATKIVSLGVDSPVLYWANSVGRVASLSTPENSFSWHGPELVLVERRPPPWADK